MAYLVVTNGSLQGQRFELNADAVRIGRRAGNDWVLDAPSVSSTHCEIVRANGGFVLRDLGSTNGTRLNGVPVQESPLSRNDIIAAGDESFKIDGEDVPVSTDLDEIVIPRTTVVIRPQVAGNAKIATSPYFQKRFDNRKLWITLIVLLGIAIVVAAYFFLRYELTGM